MILFSFAREAGFAMSLEIPGSNKIEARKVASMIDVIELIPSKDMRNALRESGREFSDMEKAAIIANLALSPLQTRQLLQELVDQTTDDLVREQVQYSLDDEKRLMDQFCEMSEGCMFGVELYDEDYPDDASVDAYFATFSLAHQFGISQEMPFKVRKWLIQRDSPDEEGLLPGGDCGWLKYDAGGQLARTCLFHLDDSEPQFFPNIMRGKWKHYLYFEDRWVDLPNLYQQGDIVQVVGTDLPGYITRAYDWAVVGVRHDEWEEYRARVNRWLEAVEAGKECVEDGRMGDYSDMQITLEFPCEDGTFVHDHINPMFIERVETEAVGDEAELRQMATWAARGECGLEWISKVLKKQIIAALSETAA